MQIGTELKDLKSEDNTRGVTRTSTSFESMLKNRKKYRGFA
jgi:hypothetical protein